MTPIDVDMYTDINVQKRETNTLSDIISYVNAVFNKLPKHSIILDVSYLSNAEHHTWKYGATITTGTPKLKELK